MSSWLDFSCPALLNVLSYLTGVKKSGQSIYLSDLCELERLGGAGERTFKEKDEEAGL